MAETRYQITFWLKGNWKNADYMGDTKMPIQTLRKALFENDASPNVNDIMKMFAREEKVTLIATSRQVARFFILRNQDKTGAWLGWSNATEIGPRTAPKPIDITRYDRVEGRD